jgi:hypothetical protein
LFRHVFETVVARCIDEGLVSGQRLAVDASPIEADTNRQNSTSKEEWDADKINPEDAPRAVREYLETLDDAAFGAATTVQPKLGSARTMIDRIANTFNLHPERLIADTAYGSAPMLDWLVEKRGIAPHIPVIDKSGRKDGTFERSDFTYDADDDSYTCPGGKKLRQFRRAYKVPRSGADKDNTMRYRAKKSDCDTCGLKSKCTPKEPQRKVTRSIYEPSRDIARNITKTIDYAISCKLRKKVEMLFAHLKRILKLDRLRLRGPCGVRDEFHLAATAQNLRKLAKLIPAPAPISKTA